MTAERSSKAVRSAFAIVELLAFSPRGLTFSEITRQLQLPKSSVHLLLGTLRQHGYISRQESDRTFHLGLRCWEIGRAFQLNDELVRQALPVMKGIVEQIDEIVQLAARESTYNVYLAKVDCQQPIQLISQVGVRLRSHATGIGKALLSCLSDEEIDRLYEKETLEQFTINTISDVGVLKQQLRLIREQGYAEDHEEYVIGLRCVAVPIISPAGQPIAAMSVSIPVPRCTPDKLNQAVDLLHDGVHQLTNAFAYPVHPGRKSEPPSLNEFVLSKPAVQ